MFVLPDPPPKDYVLRAVKPNDMSNQEHSPFAPPRVTQPNIGQFLYPLPNKDGEHTISKVPDAILDRWVTRHRENWVEKPTKDARFMHNLYKKYNSPMGEVNPQYMKRPSIFPRSYKYELDCHEIRRLNLLDRKLDTDESRIKDCICPPGEGQEDAKPFTWTEAPKLFDKSHKDPCNRRAEFAKWGQPYKSEACNFYYKYYPAPYIPYRPKKIV